MVGTAEGWEPRPWRDREGPEPAPSLHTLGSVSAGPTALPRALSPLASRSALYPWSGLGLSATAWSQIPGLGLWTDKEERVGRRLLGLHSWHLHFYLGDLDRVTAPLGQFLYL